MLSGKDERLNIPFSAFVKELYNRVVPISSIPYSQLNQPRRSKEASDPFVSFESIDKPLARNVLHSIDFDNLYPRNYRDLESDSLKIHLKYHPNILSSSHSLDSLTKISNYDLHQIQTITKDVSKSTDAGTAAADFFDKKFETKSHDELKSYLDQLSILYQAKKNIDYENNQIAQTNDMTKIFFPHSIQNLLAKLYGKYDKNYFLPVTALKPLGINSTDLELPKSADYYFRDTDDYPPFRNAGIEDTKTIIPLSNNLYHTNTSDRLQFQSRGISDHLLKTSYDSTSLSPFARYSLNANSEFTPEPSNETLRKVNNMGFADRNINSFNLKKTPDDFDSINDNDYDYDYYDENHDQGKVGTERDNKFSGDDIRVIEDNSANEITSKYRADAITIGANIIIANNKLDLQSPWGIALLAHELTHIHQLKNLSNTNNFKNDDLNKLIIRNRSSLEKEALENEQSVLHDSSINFNDPLMSGNYPNASIIKSYDLLSKIISPLNIAPGRIHFYFSTNPSVSDIYDDKRIMNGRGSYFQRYVKNVNHIPSSNNRNNDPLGWPTSYYDQINFPNYFLNSHYSDNRYSYNSEYIFDNPHVSTNFAYEQGITPQPVYMKYPQLSYRDHGNALDDRSESSFPSTSPPPSPASPHISSISLPSSQLTIPETNITPLFADQSRNIPSMGSIDVQPPSQGIQSASNNNTSATHSGFSSGISSPEIESIAEKVFQLLQNKIKLEKARRGIR